MLGACGVYGEDDTRFLFTNVIVGRKTYARFKITNANKVRHSLLLGLINLLTIFFILISPIITGARRLGIFCEAPVKQSGG